MLEAALLIGKPSKSSGSPHPTVEPKVSIENHQSAVVGSQVGSNQSPCGEAKTGDSPGSLVHILVMFGHDLSLHYRFIDVPQYPTC